MSGARVGLSLLSSLASRRPAPSAAGGGLRLRATGGAWLRDAPPLRPSPTPAPSCFQKRCRAARRPEPGSLRIAWLRSPGRAALLSATAQKTRRTRPPLAIASGRSKSPSHREGARVGLSLLASLACRRPAPTATGRRWARPRGGRGLPLRLARRYAPASHSASPPSPPLLAAARLPPSAQKAVSPRPAGRAAFLSATAPLMAPAKPSFFGLVRAAARFHPFTALSVAPAGALIRHGVAHRVRPSGGSRPRRAVRGAARPPRPSSGAPPLLRTRPGAPAPRPRPPSAPCGAPALRRGALSPLPSVGGSPAFGLRGLRPLRESGRGLRPLRFLSASALPAR